MKPAEGGAWWFVRRQDNHQPTSWINDASGVISHEDRVVEVYWVETPEDIALEADHVKICDQTIVPEHLQTTDKKDLRPGLASALRKPPKSKSSWLTLLMASMA